MRIQTKKINNKKIIASVDTEDNSIDIAIVVDEFDSPVTFNISIENDDIVRLRKWIGYGDSEDEEIYLSDIEED